MPIETKLITERVRIATCLRCGNEWTPRSLDPKACPKCHTSLWNTPYKRKPKESGDSK